MEEIFYPSSDGKHTVHAAIWRPEGEVKAILQIIHGMEEYCTRYAPFAEEAARRGILVCAEDHLGHGKTADGEGDLGHFPEGGAELVLKDIRTLTLKAKDMAPNVPFFIMGHSMGSFFCRAYIARWSQDIAGEIVMGTGFKDPVTLFFARLITKIISKAKGSGYKSKFIAKLAFGTYNKKFRPANTGYEWLSAEEGNVRSYVSDGLCGFGFTCGLCRAFRYYYQGLLQKRVHLGAQRFAHPRHRRRGRPRGRLRQGREKDIQKVPRRRRKRRPPDTLQGCAARNFKR